MDHQKSDQEELERKLEQARRLATVVSDQTTLQRISDFADELKQRLRQLMPRRRVKFGSEQDDIRARARELWEQHGKPTGRDKEFWFRAEREFKEASDLEKQTDRDV
jgi:hypothetical protein